MSDADIPKVSKIIYHDIKELSESTSLKLGTTSIEVSDAIFFWTSNPRTIQEKKLEFN